MGKPKEETPDQWSPLQPMNHAGADIYWYQAGPIEAGGNADNIWVYHWHMPAEGAHRWTLSKCGLHTVVQVEPLTLTASLACEDGCPSHGFLENGSWRAV